MVLLAVVPERCAFVAKRELRGISRRGSCCGNIGTRLSSASTSRSSVEARPTSSRRRPSTACHSSFFPEGTLQREPGLLPFRLGAFQAATAAGTPVVPLAIRGIRSVLRDGQWRPRRGVIQIIVMPPIAPDGGDWAAAVRLRDRARAAILAVCGEPDLAGRGGGQASPRSDNGAWQDVFPDAGYRAFRGTKGMVSVGGNRVPAIAWWSSKIKSGEKNHESVSGLALMATSTALGGVPAPLMAFALLFTSS